MGREWRGAANFPLPLPVATKKLGTWIIVDNSLIVRAGTFCIGMYIQWLQTHFFSLMTRVDISFSLAVLTGSASLMVRWICLEILYHNHDTRRVSNNVSILLPDSHSWILDREFEFSIWNQSCRDHQVKCGGTRRGGASLRPPSSSTPRPIFWHTTGQPPGPIH